MDKHDRFNIMKSLMPKFPCTKLYETTTCLGAFGGATPKRIKLWSSESWICNMKRKLPTDFKREPGLRLVTVKDKKVTGGRDLKASENYPAEYGKELRRQWYAHRGCKPIPRGASDSDSDSESIPDDFPMDLWEDCGLASLCASKNVPVDRLPF